MRTSLVLKLAVIPLAIVATIAAGCTATESVTLSDTAAASAATTAPPAGRDDSAREGGEDRDGISAAPPAEESGDTAPERVTPATPAPTTDASSSDECRFIEVDDFGDIQIELAFVATDLDMQEDTSLDYVLVDGTGVEIARSSTFFEDLKPGERVRMALDTVEDAPTDPAALAGITCEILDLEPFGFSSDPFRAQAGDSCRFIELDGFGDIQIELDLANPLTESGDLAIDYALRSSDGVRFGDGVVFTEAFAPGERLVEAEDTLTDVPGWLDESEITCEILAIEDF